MKNSLLGFVLLLTLAPTVPAAAQVDEDELGLWAMYFASVSFDDSPWGFQGDLQLRNWDVGDDLEQLLIRGGVTWSPPSGGAKFTLGVANITSGEFGPSSDTSREDRVYQEALLPHRIGQRVRLRHRFRTEQRWVDGQDFRTRFRYAVFMDIPLNRLTMDKGVVYLAVYNELFINGELNIGDGRTVERFDRDRMYLALGYGLTDSMKVQFGYMFQESNSVGKGQLQLSLHQNF